MVIPVIIYLTYSYDRDTGSFQSPKVKIVLDDGKRLCCTNPVRDSSRESSVVAGRHEQTHTPELQDQELAGLQ